MASIKTEAQLAEFIAQFYDDPLGFVMGIFPWGEPTLPNGSINPLRDKQGPEDWQRLLLEDLGEHIKDNVILRSIGLDMKVWKSAVASGHGVGKSTMMAWLNIFFMSTRVDTRGAITANTQFQLEDKTWPELAKWHALALNNHWFQWTATSFYFKQYPDDKRKNYMMTAATVSEQRTEAFAGLHNEGKTIVLGFDESSGVPPGIWVVAEGALTDGEAFFFAFGNPTRPDGDFADCFDKHAQLYWHMNVDSRSVSHTNKLALQGILDKYGEDSDEAKIRVKGIFPSQSFNGFIGIDVANSAINRDVDFDHGAAIIMGVDVARFGNDESVIGYRQGRDAKNIPWKYFKGISTTKLAGIIMTEANIIRPDMIVIEATGPGAGVIDQLRDKNYRVTEVHPGAAASEHRLYFNRRAEIWSLMRDWLAERGCIEDEPILYNQLVKIKYSLDRHEQRTKLEPKEEMKKRGLTSPDRADALALTFATRVARRDSNLNRKVRAHSVARMDYDLLAL